MTEETLFGLALDHPPAERERFLADACPDPAVRRRVAGLLAANDRAGGFLEPATPAAAGVDRPTPPPDPPATDLLAGRYRLGPPLGEGGMGTVYLAEQTTPVRREVAVKVIRPAVASPAVRARFEAERQALALMDHPHIAAVFDGGTTPDGRPFLVMERVPGVPVTRFCDDRKLPVAARLELFLNICHAVQHAHQKGVIHRDLKPSNILVAEADGRFTPKVIDFGVAKAVGRPADFAGKTEFGTVVGTPEYMSPEQAELSALDIDTRADVYALSVLLYELLAGSTPLARKGLHETPLLEVLREVRETDPPPPSVRAAAAPPAVAAARGTDPARLPKLLRGDLDWVTLKGLAKDRNRRYESAAALADDVRRHLADEPVAAGPPARSYRVRKFVRRNRGAVLAAALLAAALVAGTAGTAWQAFRATGAEAEAVASAGRAKEDRDKAVAAEADATAFNNFVVKHLLAASRPENARRGLGKDVTLADALATAEPAVAEAFAGRPAAEAKARIAVGKTWAELGRFADAERQYARALDLYAQLGAADSLAALQAEAALVSVLHRGGKLPAARAAGEASLARLTTLLGPDHTETLTAENNLAMVYHDAGPRPKALEMFRSLVPRRTAAIGADHPDTLVSLNNLALGLNAAGERAEALKRYEDVVTRRRRVLGPDHPDTLGAMNNVARVLKADNRLAEAIAMYEQTAGRMTEVLGPNHSSTLVVQNNLAAAYMANKRVKDAVKLFETVLDLRRKALPADHKDIFTSMNTLAVGYRADGRLADAIALQEQTLAGRTRVLGPAHEETLTTAYNLGNSYLQANRPADAIPLFERVHAAETGERKARLAASLAELKAKAKPRREVAPPPRISR